MRMNVWDLPAEPAQLLNMGKINAPDKAQLPKFAVDQDLLGNTSCQHTGIAS